MMAYCDYNELSSHLSADFKKKQRNETHRNTLMNYHLVPSSILRRVCLNELFEAVNRKTDNVMAKRKTTNNDLHNTL